MSEWEIEEEIYALGSWHSLTYPNGESRKVTCNVINNSGYVMLDFLDTTNYIELASDINLSEGSNEINLNNYSELVGSDVVVRLRLYSLETSPEVSSLSVIGYGVAQSSVFTGSLDIASINRVYVNVDGTFTENGSIYISTDEGDNFESTLNNDWTNLNNVGSRLVWRAVGSPTTVINEISIDYKSDDITY